MDKESNNRSEKEDKKMESDVSVSEPKVMTSVEEEFPKVETDAVAKCELITPVKDVPNIKCDVSVTDCKLVSSAPKTEADDLVTESAEEKKESGSKSEKVSRDEIKDGAKNSSKGSRDAEGNPSNEIDESNLHYENGICVYTDPDSKCQFIWDDTKQEWVARETPDSFSDKDYEYDGKTYTYTDKETNIKYSWNEEKKIWDVYNNESDRHNSEENASQNQNEDNSKMKNPNEISTTDVTQGSYSFENDTHVYTDPSDGSKYFWDKEKSAWFPKVDDDFLAHYQMSYGFVDPNANDPKPEEKKTQPPPKEAEKRKAPQEPAWFEVGQESTKVYVSGLPLDITESEFVELMQKCGLVMRDIDTGKMKVKIYLDPDTSLPKGDALCTYIKKESVEMALQLLHGSDVRGHRITVQRAKFTMKGQYDPSLKPKKKRKKDKEKIKKIQEKLFAWMPDKLRGERAKHEKIIIVKNLFQPEIFDKDVKLILEYQQDLREECLKCGAVKKVVIFDRHPEGVAQINFKEFEAADACIQLLNGRWFGQRKITAEAWDGKTKYKITETDEEIKARRADWEKYLEAGEGAEKGEKKKSEKTVVKHEEESARDSEKTDLENDQRDSAESERDSEKMDSENIQRDSDGDTRSSVESDYDTDDETKT